MKLSYNVTGQDRKSLAGAVSSFLNAPTRYLGMPTAAYEVGGYTIDKAGTVTGKDNPGLEDALRQAGFDADGGTREYDEPDTYKIGLGGMGAVPTPEETEAEAPQPKHKGIMDTLVEALNETTGDGEHWERLHSAPQMECGDGRWRNLDGTYAETASVHAGLTASVTDDHGGEYDENGRYIHGTGGAACFPEDGMDAGDVPTMITVELPSINVKEEILRSLIESKATLIKSALGEDGLGELPIEFGNGRVAFHWLRFGADADTVKAWSAFLAAACRFSKTAKRVTAKDTAATNEKFAFRTFMVKIGMNSADNKSIRKRLLQNLTGDSAFATPESKARWLAKHGKQASEKAGGNETAEPCAD